MSGPPIALKPRSAMLLIALLISLLRKKLCLDALIQGARGSDLTLESLVFEINFILLHFPFYLCLHFTSLSLLTFNQLITSVSLQTSVFTFSHSTVSLLSLNVCT